MVRKHSLHRTMCPNREALHSLILSIKGVFCPLGMHTPSGKSRNETSLAPSIYIFGGVRLVCSSVEVVILV